MFYLFIWAVSAINLLSASAKSHPQSGEVPLCFGVFVFLTVALACRIPRRRPPVRPLVKTAFCPQCSQETFIIRVTESGTHETEFGMGYWCAGFGRCLTCGHRDYWSDSSL